MPGFLKVAKRSARPRRLPAVLPSDLLRPKISRGSFAAGLLVPLQLRHLAAGGEKGSKQGKEGAADRAKQRYRAFVCMLLQRLTEYFFCRRNHCWRFGNNMCICGFVMNTNHPKTLKSRLVPSFPLWRNHGMELRISGKATRWFLYDRETPRCLRVYPFRSDPFLPTLRTVQFS